MIKSYCVCKKDENKTSRFKPFIVYKNETVFKDYEGISIYKCLNCGVLKTIPDKKNKIKQESRSEYYEDNKQKFRKLFEPIVEKIKKNKKNGRALDVGCSSGILLEMLKELDFDIYGVEPDKKAYLTAKNKFRNRVFNG